MIGDIVLLCLGSDQRVAWFLRPFQHRPSLERPIEESDERHHCRADQVSVPVKDGIVYSRHWSVVRSTAALASAIACERMLHSSPLCGQIAQLLLKSQYLFLGVPLLRKDVLNASAYFISSFRICVNGEAQLTPPPTDVR